MISRIFIVVFAVLFVHSDCMALQASLHFSGFGVSGECIEGDNTSMALTLGTLTAGLSKGNSTVLRHGKPHCRHCVGSVSGPGTHCVEVSSESFAFGTLVVDSDNRRTKTIRLRNRCASDISLYAPKLVVNPDNAFEFDTTQFQSYPVTVRAGEEVSLTVQCTPQNIGQHLGYLRVKTTDKDSLDIQISYTGRSNENATRTTVRLLMDNPQGKPGDKVTISLVLETIQGTLSTSSFNAVIRFRRDVLFPLNIAESRRTYSAGNMLSLRIDSALQETPGAGSILISIPCLVLLGETDRTSVIFAEFDWIDRNIQVIRTVNLDRFLVENGNRFVTSRRRAAVLQAVAPNPADAVLDLAFDVFHKDHVELFIVDLYSRKVRSLLSKDVNPGRHRRHFSLEGLASGVYFLLLQSTTGLSQQRIDVIR